MKCKILGIDPSLNSTGLCLINERGTVLDCKALCHSLEDPERLYYLYESMKDYFISYRPDYISYERQVPQMRYNYTASSIVPLAELAGIMKLSILEYCRINPSAVILRYPPEDIKHFATGNGKATKEQMMDAVPIKSMSKIKYFIPGDSVNDVSDAYHIANMVRELLLSEENSVNKLVKFGKEYDFNVYYKLGGQ